VERAAVISALILIGVAFAICLAATPFLVIIWLLHKWSKWVQGMVNGSEKNDGKELVKLLGKLLSK
jgi:hypothetical protein